MDMQSRLLGIYAEKDTNSIITACDEKFLVYTGAKSKDEIIGHTDFDFIWQDYAPMYRNHEVDVMSGNQYSAVIPLKDAQGNTHLFLHNKVAKRNSDRVVIGIIAHAVEILNPNYYELISMLSKINLSKKPIFSIGKRLTNIKFTPREEQCLFYLLYGKTAKAIARVLNISPRTAETYIEQLKIKFGCHNKMELIDTAINLGFLNQVPSFMQAKELVKGLKE